MICCVYNLSLLFILNSNSCIVLRVRIILTIKKCKCEKILFSCFETHLKNNVNENLDLKHP